MSKSRGTGISPLRYLDLGMDAEWLRYYNRGQSSTRVSRISASTRGLRGARQQRSHRQVRQHRQPCAKFITAHFHGELRYPPT